MALQLAPWRPIHSPGIYIHISILATSSPQFIHPCMPNRDIRSAQLSSVKEEKKEEKEEEEGVARCELAELHDLAEEKSYKCPPFDTYSYISRQAGTWTGFC